MARGTTLANLRLMLKSELGVDSDSNVAPGGDDVLNTTLANQQRWLACEYDFPFKSYWTDVAMVAGQRYYDFPNNAGVPIFNMERPIKAECYWSTLWYSVENGIKLINYNTLNPDLGQRLDPVIRWEPYNQGTNSGNTTTGNTFEVWPLPATATKLRLRGQSALNPLVADTDTADLDDKLIVLFAAAELLQRMGDASAGAKAKRAEMLLQRERGGITGGNEVFSMRGGGYGDRRHKDSIRPMVGVNLTPPL